MKRLVILFIMIAIFCKGQTFSDYRTQYDNFEENDQRAFEFINPYIKAAKIQKNNTELVQAYRDAVSFSSKEKLKYADSAIAAAQKTSNKEILGKAYLTKGSVYYFNERRFSLALEEYLKAWKWIKDSEDEYLIHKNLYHIAVVKTYLGYYEDALGVFRRCSAFYQQKTPLNFPNLEYNTKKGYLNSLNQTGICLLHLSKFQEVQKIIDEGLRKTLGEPNFYLERSYFYKLKAILQFIQKKDKEAMADCTIALAGIEKKADFTNASFMYYLKGKILLRNQNLDQAIQYFTKVDSVFINHHFILPASRESYELLIKYYRNKKQIQKELYYTRQLLKVDCKISNDFRYITGKMFKDFDTKQLLESKERLQKSVSQTKKINILLWFLLGGGGMMMVMKIKNKWNVIPPEEVIENTFEDASEKTSKLPPKLTTIILGKLDKMEETKMYLEVGLTQSKLASKLKTNTSYLSKVINEYKGTNFNGYINGLRIEYVKRMLREDSQWIKFSVDSIAKLSGFNNRTHFIKIFHETTDMSIMEFISQVKSERNNQIFHQKI